MEHRCSEAPDKRALTAKAGKGSRTGLRALAWAGFCLRPVHWALGARERAGDAALFGGRGVKWRHL